jgi:hypothetical protein
MPSPQDHTARLEAYRAWLTANGIDPSTVPWDGDVVIVDNPDGTRSIVYEEFELDDQGRKQLDERLQHAAIRKCSTALIEDPPEWWKPYQKPTRDQLLATEERIRSLVDDGPPSGTAAGGEWEGGWDSAMEAVKNVLDGRNSL